MTSAPPSDLATSGFGANLHAAALDLAAFALAIMPLAMWLANRSAPLCLAIAALACLVVGAGDGCPLMDRLRLARMAASPITRALLLALALAIASLFWSHRPLASLFALGEMLVPLVAGVVVAIILPPRAPRWMLKAFVASLMLALALTIFELQFGLELRGAAGLRAMLYTFNRSLICAILLAIPLVGWLLRMRHVVPALLVVMAVSLAVMMSESGAAKLGLGVALMAGFAAALAPRFSVIAASVGLVAMVAFAPVQGEIAERLIPPAAHRQLQDSHSRDRVDIWLSFGEAIRARPLLGAGFGTSPSLQEHPVAAEVPEGRRKLLAVGHPHSAQVQIWSELGVLGAGLMLWAGLSTLIAIGRTEKAAFPKRWAKAAPMAACGCAVAIAAVGHGAWQGWWMATLAATIVWFRVLDARKS